MKTTKALLLSLATAGSLLMPLAGQAETIFERFAPPLPPVIVPRIVIGNDAPHGGYHRPPPRYERYDYRPAREYHHHHYYDDHYRYREPRHRHEHFRERHWR